MEWKEEGVGETGSKAGDYNAAVQTVKQGVSEAIRRASRVSRPEKR